MEFLDFSMGDVAGPVRGESPRPVLQQEPAQGHLGRKGGRWR